MYYLFIYNTLTTSIALENTLSNLHTSQLSSLKLRVILKGPAQRYEIGGGIGFEGGGVLGGNLYIQPLRQ